MADGSDVIGQFHSGFLRFCVTTTSELSDCSGLLIGQMASGASATANQVTRISGLQDAIDKFGADSILAKMVQMWLCACGGRMGRSMALYALPVADAGGATAAAYTITVTGPATENKKMIIELPTGANNNLGNVLSLGNANAKYEVSVVSGDTAVEIAAKIKAAIDADSARLFTTAIGADPNDHIVTLTAKNGGTAMNGIALETEPYYGYSLPAGVGIAWAQTVQGATDPDLATAFGGLGNCAYTCWALGWNDATAKDLLVTELQSRWDCGGDNTFGHGFTWLRDTVTNMISTANPTDYAVINYIPVPATYKYPGWMLTAAWAGRNCCHVCNTNDPGIPVVRSNGILPCLCDVSLCGGQPFSRTEMELMAQAGISTWTINAAGTVYIVDNVTNFKRDEFGQYSRTFKETSSRFVVMAIIAKLTEFYETYYSAHKLVGNDVSFDGNRRVTSPSAFKAHLIGWMNGQTDDALAYNLAETLLATGATGEDLLVQADTAGQAAGAGDCNRLNVVLRASLIQPLLRIGTTIDVQACN